MAVWKEAKKKKRKRTRAGGREGREGAGRAFLKLGQTADYNGDWDLGYGGDQLGLVEYQGSVPEA